MIWRWEKDGVRKAFLVPKCIHKKYPKVINIHKNVKSLR